VPNPAPRYSKACRTVSGSSTRSVRPSLPRQAPVPPELQRVACGHHGIMAPHFDLTSPPRLPSDRHPGRLSRLGYVGRSEEI